MHEVGRIEGIQFVAILCPDTLRWDIVKADTGCIVRLGVRSSRVVPRLRYYEKAVGESGIQGSLDGLLVKRGVAL